MAHENSSLVVSCCCVHDRPYTGKDNYSTLDSLGISCGGMPPVVLKYLNTNISPNDI